MLALEELSCIPALGTHKVVLATLLTSDSPSLRRPQHRQMELDQGLFTFLIYLFVKLGQIVWSNKAKFRFLRDLGTKILSSTMAV